MRKDKTDYLTITEASKRLGVAPNTLRSWGANGKIQEYRHPLNNYRLYRREDVSALAKVLECPVKVLQADSPSHASTVAHPTF